MPNAPALTLDDLLVWGRDWEAYNSRPIGEREGYEVPLAVLRQYLTVSNKAIEAVIRAKAKRKPKRKGGRPRGNSMGEQYLRLIANGVTPDDARRMVAADHQTTVEQVKVSVRTARRDKKTN